MIVSELIAIIPFKSLAHTLIKDWPQKSFHTAYTKGEGITVHFYYFKSKTGESEELVHISCPQY